jgi:hypothetical protein
MDDTLHKDKEASLKIYSFISPDMPLEEIHFIEIDISLFFFYSLYEKMKSADGCTLEVSSSSSSSVFIVENR